MQMIQYSINIYTKKAWKKRDRRDKKRKFSFKTIPNFKCSIVEFNYSKLCEKKQTDRGSSRILLRSESEYDISLPHCDEIIERGCMMTLLSDIS